MPRPNDLLALLQSLRRTASAPPFPPAPGTPYGPDQSYGATYFPRELGPQDPNRPRVPWLGEGQAYFTNQALQNLAALSPTFSRDTAQVNYPDITLSSINDTQTNVHEALHANAVARWGAANPPGWSSLPLALRKKLSEAYSPGGIPGVLDWGVQAAKRGDVKDAATRLEQAAWTALFGQGGAGLMGANEQFAVAGEQGPLSVPPAARRFFEDTFNFTGQNKPVAPGEFSGPASSDYARRNIFRGIPLPPVKAPPSRVLVPAGRALKPTKVMAKPPVSVKRLGGQ